MTFRRTAIGKGGLPATQRAAVRPLLRLAALLWIALGAAAVAHEVRPTVGDLSVSGARVTLDLDLNVEAFVAGVDLDGVADINATPQAESYDAVRALEPDALADRFAPVAAGMAGRIGLTTGDGTRLDLRFAAADIGPVGDVATLRDSRARFVAEAAGPIEALTLAWPEDYGTLILRQMGVADGYTGFLDGGMASDPIRFAGAGAPTGGRTVLVEAIPRGFGLILPAGVAQILFVVALALPAMRGGRLARHAPAALLGIAGGLALQGVAGIGPPPAATAALVAAGLVCLGAQNVVADPPNAWRTALALLIGWAQGMALAGALGATGLPALQAGWAYAGLLLGIAIGLLTALSLVYLLVGHWFADASWYRRRLVQPASAAIAAYGLWMLWAVAGPLVAG